MITPIEFLGAMLVQLLFLVFVTYPIFRLAMETKSIRTFGVCKSSISDAHRMEWDGRKMWFKCETCGTVAIDIAHDREGVLK